MDKEVKIDVSLLTTCHGCLSNDRTITYLGDNGDMLISMLGAHRQCLVYGIEDIKLCWECTTMLKKFKLFQNQVRSAQAGLMKMLYEIDFHIGTLSKLTIVNKYYYDQDIKHYGQKKLKKNNEQLEDITIIKTEFEDIRSYSDDDDTFLNLIENKTDDFDNKLTETENKINTLTNKTDTYNVINDNKIDTYHVNDNKIDTYNVKDNKIDTSHEGDRKIETFPNTDLSIAKPELEIEYELNIKDEKLEIPSKLKKPRRFKDTQCVSNVVGYYKRYAKLVKSVKKDWGSWVAVRAHFESTYFSEKDMEDHFFIKDRRNTSYERLLHKCHACTLGYIKENDLKRHNDLNHHKEGAPYKCSYCTKRVPSHDALETHWRMHSIVYRCRSCGDVCKENAMRKHLDHAHTKTYDCTVCHCKFGTLKSFTLHYKEMHMKYVCDYCGHTLTTKKKIQKHILDHHMKFSCKDCNRQYKNYIYYKKHCHSIHPEKVSSKLDPELSFCVECNKQFPSVDKYKTHLRVSTKHNKKSRGSFPCPECGRIFGRKKNLNYHFNLFHLKKTKYYCELCDKYFCRPSGLRTHKENVHLKIEKVKDKICDLCGRAFSNNVVLRHHRRTHTGERPHKCPHCAAEFIQKYAMQTHVRTQHKEFAKELVKKVSTVPPVPAWPEAGYFV